MKSIHHANIITGTENCREFVFEILKNDLEFKVEANPDFLLLENDSFGIDDARNIIRWSLGKPLSGEIKISFIISKTLTREAQNALLKVLEEPPLGTYFFIWLENLGGLLPTFISRTKVLDARSKEGYKDLARKEKPEKKIARDFLNADFQKRISMSRSICKNRDKNEIAEILKELERIAAENLRASSHPAKFKSLKNTLTAKILSSTKGSSPKILLDWLSFVV